MQAQRHPGGDIAGAAHHHQLIPLEAHVILHQPTRFAVFHLQQLGEDADGDLLGGLGADVVADGGVQLLQLLLAHPLLAQRLGEGLHLALAGEQPQIGEGTADEPIQRLLVLMVGGDDDEVGGLDGQFLDHRADGIGLHQMGTGREEVRVEAPLEAIPYMDIKAERRRGMGHSPVDVAGTNEHQPWSQTIDIDIDRHGTTAIRPDRMLTVACHPAVEDARLALGNGGHRFLDHQPLDHAAADGTEDLAIGHYQHLGLMARGGAPALDDLGHGKRRVLLFQSGCVCKQIHKVPLFILKTSGVRLKRLPVRSCADQVTDGGGFAHGPLPDGVDLGVAALQLYQFRQPRRLILIIAIDKPDPARPGRGALEHPLGVGEQPVKQCPIQWLTRRNPAQGLQFSPAVDLRWLGIGSHHGAAQQGDHPVTLVWNARFVQSGHFQ